MISPTLPAYRSWQCESSATLAGSMRRWQWPFTRARWFCARPTENLLFINGILMLSGSTTPLTTLFSFYTHRGAQASVIVASIAAWITEGSIANTGHGISNLATLRLLECIPGQFEGEILAFPVYPGAVRTEMAGEPPETFVPREPLSSKFSFFEIWLTRLNRSRLDCVRLFEFGCPGDDKMLNGASGACF